VLELANPPSWLPILHVTVFVTTVGSERTNDVVAVSVVGVGAHLGLVGQLD
jgi:hypothetical protein